MNTDDCIFCKIANGTMKVERIYEDEHTVAFKDINPQAPYHFLVIPKQHIPKINDIDDSNAQLAYRLIDAANRLAKQIGIDEEGYRLVINSGDNGGQTVYHLHVHVLGGRFMRWPPG